MHSHHALRFFERPAIPAKARVSMLLGKKHILVYNSPSPTPAMEAIQLLNDAAMGTPVTPSLAASTPDVVRASVAICDTRVGLFRNVSELLHGRAADFPSFADKCAVFRRLEHAAEVHRLGGDQGASTAPSGFCARCRSRPPSSASWRRGRCSRAVTSTGRSCWAVDERYSYGVVAAPGFDSKSLPPRPIFIDRSRVVFQCFWLCLLPSQRRLAYLRGELTEGRSFHFGSLSLACERP